MNASKRLPRKAWLLLACALVLALGSLFSAQTGRLGPTSPRDAFLDAVAADLARDQRVAVERQADQLVVHIKPTHRTLTLVVTKALAEGEGQSWAYEWKDEGGKVVALGQGRGVIGKTLHLDVPGLP